MENPRFEKKAPCANFFVESLIVSKPGIYVIVNAVNGKIYIGSARNIRQRWTRHQYELNKGIHSNKILQRAWKKHEPASFFAKTLQICSREELGIVEQEWLNLTQCFRRDIGYNILSKAYSGLRPRKQCSNCDKPFKPLRHGRCQACAEYYRRTHKERPVADGYSRANQVTISAKSCRGCHTSFKVIKHKSKGLCRKCYELDPIVKYRNNNNRRRKRRFLKFFPGLNVKLNERTLSF